ncbi:16329_t:CDS:2 [Racocetra fulgida]|uniref:16329_t:CDS:1 n=1 Tax=Racocetra fulgida TaxID=60492 RepID=A0A9N9D5B5_9GLOM|nr:16329_t:CDS:2 [Racocetra fulgida]
MSISNRESEPVVSNDASAQLDMMQANLESNLKCLSLEALRVVCRRMDVSDVGSNKEVVARLARESKAWMGPEEAIGEPEPSKKRKNVQPQFLGNRDESFSEELDAFQSASDRPQQLRAVVENSSDPYRRQAMFGLNFAYIGTLDKKAPTYVVRVADEDDASDSISELLGSKREKAKLVVQHFTKVKKPRSAYHPRSEQSQTQAPIFHLSSRGQHLQYVSSNIGLSSPIWQQSYLPASAWSKKER